MPNYNYKRIISHGQNQPVSSPDEELDESFLDGNWPPCALLSDGWIWMLEGLKNCYDNYREDCKEAKSHTIMNL